jgi:phage repressor protein C with HTH and peptisase S24 domain
MFMNNTELKKWVQGVQASGITLKDWAKASGFERANFLYNFLKKPEGGLRSSTVDKLKAGLAKLRGETREKTANNAPILNDRQSTDRPALPNDTKMLHAAPTRGLPEFVPVYGPAAAASPERILLTEQYIVDEKKRPMELAAVRDGFLMFVAGDSMYPRYEHGDLVSVHPYKHPTVGKDCVLVLAAEGNAIVKRFDGEADNRTAWKLYQHNPPKYIKVKKSEVRNIYAIVGRPS